LSQTRLYRSVRDRKIAGVAAGIAAYLSIDVTVIRLLCLLSIFVGGLLAYIIAWIVIPEENPDVNHEVNDSEEPSSQVTDRQKRLNLVGLILVVIGVFFLFRAILPWKIDRYFWPLLLIAGGILLLVRWKKPL
jgi:phage shock protein C